LLQKSEISHLKTFPTNKEINLPINYYQMKCGQKHFMSQTRVAPVLFISLEIAPAANKRELM